MPAWVFFDVDQTLCDFETTMRRAVSSTVEEIRRRYPGASADHLSTADLYEARDRIAEVAPAGTSMEQIRRESLATVLDLVHPDATTDELDAIAAFYFDARFERPDLYADVVPTLEILARRYRLGVITNGNSHPRRLGLHGYFAEVVLSTEVGVAKPDPAIYRLAATRAAVPPADLVMVGDSQVNDVDAAIAAGWRAVRLDRDPRIDGPAPTSGPVITSLTELPALLETT
jgi:HAD superfamily hydrolase (TIGR01509 family)